MIDVITNMVTGQVSSCNILFNRGSQDRFQANRPTSAPNSLGTLKPRTTSPPRDPLRPPLPLAEWVNEDPLKICERIETFFDGFYDNTSSGTLTFGVARVHHLGIAVVLGARCGTAGKCDGGDVSEFVGPV